jgi:GPH family glycoside/pentoside/hexuronide:cation symporter
MFIYIVFMGLLYLLIYTMYVVPYTALGYELTTDYDERTRVLAWRMYIGLFGSLTVPWFYWLCIKFERVLAHLPEYATDMPRLNAFFAKIQPFMGTGTAASAFWISIGLGGTIILSGILPALICREPAQGQHQAKIHIFKAIGYTFRNKPFLILSVSYVIIIFGLISAGTLGLYVNIYYVCGTKELAAKIGGISGSIGAITSYISLFLIAWISSRWGKRNAMIIGLTFALAGVCSAWWTLTPGMPYLQLISSFISCLGLQGCWLMVSSMVADVCDEDELKTGLRREGIYSAVNGLSQKMAFAFTILAGGVLLNLAAYDPKVAEKTGSVPLEIALKMKTLMIIGQMIALLFAIAILFFYPITRKRAEETRRILDERHRQHAPIVVDGI